MREDAEEMARREAKELAAMWLAMAVAVAVSLVVAGLLAGGRDAAVLERATVRLGALEVRLALVRWASVVCALGLLAAAGWMAHRRLAETVVLAHAMGETELARLQSGFSHLRRYSLAAWALAEAVALVGALLSILTGRTIDVLPYAIAGGTTLMLLKPEVPSLMELAGKMSAAAADVAGAANSTDGRDSE